MKEQILPMLFIVLIMISCKKEAEEEPIPVDPCIRIGVDLTIINQSSSELYTYIGLYGCSYQSMPLGISETHIQLEANHTWNSILSHDGADELRVSVINPYDKSIESIITDIKKQLQKFTVLVTFDSVNLKIEFL